MRSLLRAAACLGAVAVLLCGAATAGASGRPVGAVLAAAPAASPSVTGSSPDTGSCPQRTAPPPAMDTSENVAPDRTSPAPLPVPAAPVGGAALDACGLVLPTRSPALPSDISAKAWAVADLDSGAVIGAKDPHGRYRPASTLKLLTMIVLLTNLTDLDQVVTGTDTDAAQEGSRVGIGPGGKYTVRQLLLFLMMGSGNDVANALARANGGYDKTVAEMNDTAAKLNARDTRAATISGLDGPGQMTSAYDLALIAREAMRHQPFPELISTQYSQVPGWGPHPGFGIANDNKLLFNYPGALGGKTGFTDDAGNTYVGLAERDGRRLVVTMLGGTQQPRRQWMQAASLLDWGFSVRPGTTPVGALVDAGGATAVADPSGTAATSSPTAASAGSPSGLTTAPATSSAGAPASVAPAVDGASATTTQNDWVWLWAAATAAMLAIGALLLPRARRAAGSRSTGGGPPQT